jgi:hypothetical protein
MGLRLQSRGWREPGYKDDLANTARSGQVGDLCRAWPTCSIGRRSLQVPLLAAQEGFMGIRSLRATKIKDVFIHVLGNSVRGPGGEGKASGAVGIRHGPDTHQQVMPQKARQGCLLYQDARQGWGHDHLEDMRRVQGASVRYYFLLPLVLYAAGEGEIEMVSGKGYGPVLSGK